MITIKVGIKIKLEMIPIISSYIIHKRILTMNFYDIDKIKTLDYINSVLVYENDLKYINLIIRFCKVTKKPLNIYIANELSDIIIQKILTHKINYKIYKI
jgi:hypothetical protein